jgi:hypothetical protein
MAQEVTKESFSSTKVKSGLEIRYRDSDHRYWVKGEDDTDWVDCDFSMSGVADVLAKGALPWWGMQIGLRAIPTLIERGYIQVTNDRQIVVMGQSTWELPTGANLEARVKEQKITVNHIRDKAGERGNSVHKALEAWAKDAVVPVPEFYPDEERGYVLGFLAFLHDLGDLKTKPLSEIMVASREHRIAGRYDLEAVLHGSKLITKKATPSWTGSPDDHHSAKGPEYTEFEGRTLFDVKTSKDVYLGHKFQMTGYEGCRRECGMPKTEQQLIVVVNDDGTYKVGVNDTTWEEFLAVLNVARIVRAKA